MEITNHGLQKNKIPRHSQYSIHESRLGFFCIPESRTRFLQNPGSRRTPSRPCHYIRKRFLNLILGATMMNCEQTAAGQETLRGQKYCASTKKTQTKQKKKQKQEAPGVFLTSRSFLAHRFLLHNSSLQRGLFGKSLYKSNATG